MAFKKVVQPAASAESVGALLQLLPGQDEQRLVEWLRKRGVTQIKCLAAGFFSVEATRATLDAAQSMARVEIKRRKAMHGDE